MTTRRKYDVWNRLRRLESPSTAAGTLGIGLRPQRNKANRLSQPQCPIGFPTCSKRKLEFEYDWQGRRIKKVSHSAWNSSSYASVVSAKFIYDSRNLLAELDSSNNVIHSYVWGTDLSGTMQGAGGVGGLLMVNESDDTPHFAAHDGNGNVMGLVKGTDGTRAATYEHDPFGQPLRATGTMALANPMRFSTKFTDNETELLYYGYRYYSPSSGRWVNRDPIEEKGFQVAILKKKNDPKNISDYAFNLNDGLNRYDPDGLVANWVAGCVGGCAWGGIGGAIGGIGGGWKGVKCGDLGGAVSGCCMGVVAQTPFAAFASCACGIMGSLAAQACSGGINLNDKCALASHLLNGALGCLVPMADSLEPV